MKPGKKHPSYGMLRISRVTHGGGRKLFGSALADHHSTIRIHVGAGEWMHDLHEDRYYGSQTPIIEIEMSSAQFAEAITSFNMGSGVPCTIIGRDGKYVEDPPDELTEVERVRKEFSNDLKEMVGTLRERRKVIDELTAKLPAKTKEKLRVALDVMIDQLASNVPFILRQFEEATSRVVTAAKHEIEAFTMHALRSAGMEALAKGHLPKLLGGSTEPEGESDG